MGDGRDGPLQLISHSQMSNTFFNGIYWFQYFDASVLMQFHCSFSIEIEIGDGRGMSLQLISGEFFWTFLDDY